MLYCNYKNKFVTKVAQRRLYFNIKKVVNDVDSVEQNIMDLEKLIEDNRIFKICLLNKIKTLSNAQTNRPVNNDLYPDSLTDLTDLIDIDLTNTTEVKFNDIKYKMQEEWLLLENLQFALYKQLELENEKIENILEQMLKTVIIQNSETSSAYNKQVYKLKEIMQNINRIYQIIF